MNQVINQRRYYSIFQITFLSAALFTVAFLFQGCQENKTDLKKEDLKTEYQATLMSGGLAYYGKVEKIGNNFIEMTDVYYVQNQQNPETKEIRGILVKRGKEWHGPDRLYLNMAHVIMIEPVAADSQIGQMIKGLRTKAPGEEK
jgi:hypothetical protein